MYLKYLTEWPLPPLVLVIVSLFQQSDGVVYFHRSGGQLSPTYSTLFWLGDQLVTWDAFDGIKTVR